MVSNEEKNKGNGKVVKRFCPVCDSDDSCLIYRDKNRREGLEIEADLVSCKDCGMKYLTNIPAFDDFKDTYVDIYTSQTFKINIPQKKVYKKVLDVGCNFGLQLKKYYEQGWDVYGIDLNGAAIVDAKNNLLAGTFEEATLDDCTFPKGEFELVRSSHVLEHVYDVKQFLRLALSFLKPGGQIDLRMPHGNSVEMKVFGKYSSQSWVPFHINFFSVGTITTILEEIGFNNIVVRTRPLPWWWVLSYRQLRSGILNKVKINEVQTNYDRRVMSVLSPFTKLFSLIGRGEELVVTAKK